MATINIHVVVNAKPLIQKGVSCMISDKDIVLTDDQFDDVYLDDKENNLITKVKPGDKLIWTLKSRTGEVLRFTGFEIDKKTWFKEKGGVPEIDITGRRMVGTVAEKGFVSYETSTYTLGISPESNKNVVWQFDPVIEGRKYP
jgi:hypothetical protein